jgi:predicted nucleic acid-binding protein
VNAANAGALRLFCAEHVVDEMYDHIRRDAASMRLSAQTLLDRWELEYLPLLRVVPDNALDLTILSGAERRRVMHLLASKDVPSVILAMALGAFYLTEDRAARWAVYDERASSQDLLNWLAPLKDGGSADQLGGAALMMLALPTAAAMNLAELGKWLAESAPWLFWPLAAVGLGATLARTSCAGLRSAVTGIGVGLEVLVECSKPYVEMVARFRAMAPAMPTWTQLGAETGRRKLLLRACLWTLARRPESDASAVELADRLPILGVGQNANLVREALWDSACFSQPHKGRWQVGHAV